MLGLAQHLPPAFHTTFLSFREGGRCQGFLNAVRAEGFDAFALDHDTPYLRRAAREITVRLGTTDLLLCHGYKANLLGRIAANRIGIPVVAVSRGWTGESSKVRLYERLDRWHLRLMDHVIAVSEGQAVKVRAAGAKNVTVIRNAARLNAFGNPNPADLERLHAMIPEKVNHLILAAGRLSPEKGFDVLIEAAVAVSNAGVILFGEGVERAKLEALIRMRKLEGRFVLPGLTGHLDRFLPWADVVVLPSYTEGMPNVALEASAAGVPVVATAVGGTPEVIANGETGWLVPPGDSASIAGRINLLLSNEQLRNQFGAAGRHRMQEQFTFSAQARLYQDLFESFLAVQRKAA